MFGLGPNPSWVSLAYDRSTISVETPSLRAIFERFLGPKADTSLTRVSSCNFYTSPPLSRSDISRLAGSFEAIKANLCNEAKLVCSLADELSFKVHPPSPPGTSRSQSCSGSTCRSHTSSSTSCPTHTRTCNILSALAAEAAIGSPQPPVCRSSAPNRTIAQSPLGLGCCVSADLRV